MKRFRITITSFILLLMCLQLGCLEKPIKEIYISVQGDDQARGTKKQPIASMEKAIELIKNFPQDHSVTVWLGEGIYELKSTIVLDETIQRDSSASISWKAMTDASPVVSGGKKLEGWQKEANGEWMVRVPDELPANFRDLYLNGKRATRARYPNKGYLRIEKAGADDRTNFYFKSGDIPRIAGLADVELVLLHDWSISRVGIGSIDWERNHLIASDTLGATSLDFFTLTYWEEQPRYFLENAPEFLDEPGEWFFDKKNRELRYKPLPGEEIEEVEAIIPVLDQLLVLKGNKGSPISNMHFEGISFAHTNWPLPANGYGGIQACNYDNRSNEQVEWKQIPAAIELDFAEHCTFSGCTFEHVGGSGMWLRQACVNNKIEDSYFEDIAGNGINIGEGQDRVVGEKQWWETYPEEVSQYNTIKGNLIEDCGKVFFGAVGVWAGLVANTRIEGNEVRNLPYTGISIGWMWDSIATVAKENSILNNHIHNIMQTLSDGGGIYSLGFQPGSLIQGNLIHDVSINVGRAESNGMFLDEGTKDILIKDNIIYNIAKSPLRFHRASTNIVSNNVLMCSEEMPAVLQYYP